MVPQLLEMMVRSFTPLAVQGGDEVLRVPAQAEAAEHQRRAVGDVRHRRVGDWTTLFMLVSWTRSTISAIASPPPMQSEATPRFLPRSFIA